MGNGTSRVVGCFAPFSDKNGVDLEFLEPLDEGLGHSFCYVRPSISESPAITPSTSERFTVDSSTLDSETLSGSFRHEPLDDSTTSNRQCKTFPETTFKAISGASVSANTSTARTGNQIALFASDLQEPAASFESTSSFAAIPLQPVRRGSGPLNGFMSGPLERGFASGPLERGASFMSGPLEKGYMSGPMDVTSDKSNFSTFISSDRRGPRLQRLIRSVSGPMRNTFSRTFSKHSTGSRWLQKLFSLPVTQLAWHTREPALKADASQHGLDGAVSQSDYDFNSNLQWAHGKAGEDRVHVVLSEEHGWLFIGIYDGFSGPDAPDFLMCNLYRAIDKELEGVLWDYVDTSLSDPCKFEVARSEQTNKTALLRLQEQSDSRKVTPLIGEGSCDSAAVVTDSSLCDLVKEIPDINKSQNISLTTTDLLQCHGTNLNNQPPKVMRLFELLQLETSAQRSVSTNFVEDSGISSWNGQQSSGIFDSGHNCPSHEIPDASEEATSIEKGSRNELNENDVSIKNQRQCAKKSSFSSKFSRMYRKQKSFHKKLFPWSYDWSRKKVNNDDMGQQGGLTRRCRNGNVDHNAVLRAMAMAFKHTEEEYMNMVEMTLDENPELALMGSCVLVMLMKDQDVYVMNLGDSRAVLAQEKANDRYPNPNFVKDDSRLRNKSRESLGRIELDRISEESPIHNSQGEDMSMINKRREIMFCRLKMRALQLSADHSTSVEEEVLRIRAEHTDDDQAILNDRVKGQLKVTRAFGAGFLKKPTCNEALLELFRVNFIGTYPYVSCTPFLLYHRLSSCDRFLVLSSDGLYQYFSNEEVVAHVTWFMENVPEGDPAQYLIAELLLRAAKKNGMNFHELLDIPQGDRRKYHDDVSVMVVSLEGRIWRSCG